MTCSEAQKRIVFLRQQIRRHDYLYYVLARPDISDREMTPTDYHNFTPKKASLSTRSTLPPWPEAKSTLKNYRIVEPN
jgi:NAD-dependent DNA ligase adenylation domain